MEKKELKKQEIKNIIKFLKEFMTLNRKQQLEIVKHYERKLNK